MGRSASLAWGAWASLSQAAASWCSRFCGSADFPRKTTPGAACGWPTVSGWTPAARACGTRPLNTSTSAPNTSRKTALSWWESGGSYCQPTLERVVRHQSSGLSGAALCPGEVHEQLARMLRQTCCQGCCAFPILYRRAWPQDHSVSGIREKVFPSWGNRPIGILGMQA